MTASKNKELGEQLEVVHMLFNYTMATLLVTHIAAALKHHFVDRDDILIRMLPAFRRK